MLSTFLYSLYRTIKRAYINDYNFPNAHFYLTTSLTWWLQNDLDNIKRLPSLLGL